MSNYMDEHEAEAYLRHAVKDLNGAAQKLCQDFDNVIRYKLVCETAALRVALEKIENYPHTSDPAQDLYGTWLIAKLALEAHEQELDQLTSGD